MAVDCSTKIQVSPMLRGRRKKRHWMIVQEERQKKKRPVIDVGAVDIVMCGIRRGIEGLVQSDETLKSQGARRQELESGPRQPEFPSGTHPFPCIRQVTEYYYYAHTVA